MSTAPPRVLIIEDDAQIRAFLRVGLESHGYLCDTAEDARRGLALATTRVPDALLLDLGLPDRDGLEVVREVRSWSQLPILVISARGQESDKVRALDLGADDYVTKPFGMAELLARLRVALRHAQQLAQADSEPVVRCGELVIDLERHVVELEGAEVRLTPTEFKLLARLARHVGKVLTHTQLLKDVWGPAHAGDVQYLRVYMGQLRHKLERDPTAPRHLVTEPGVGYRLVE